MSLGAEQAGSDTDVRRKPSEFTGETPPLGGVCFDRNLGWATGGMGARGAVRSAGQARSALAVKVAAARIPPSGHPSGRTLLEESL